MSLNDNANDDSFFYQKEDADPNLQDEEAFSPSSQHNDDNDDSFFYKESPKESITNQWGVNSKN